MGRQVPIRAGVGASGPTGGRAGVCACGRTGGFPLAPSPLRIATRSNRAPHRAASPAPAPESARQSPPKGNCLRQSCRLSMQAGWLSSGQTIGAVRTAVRSACCLPELRVANRLRRLCPLGTRFPSFPPCTPFGPHSARKPQGKQSSKNMRGFLGANNRRVRPHREQGIAPAGAQNAFLKAKHQRGPHCFTGHLRQRPDADARKSKIPAAGPFLRRGFSSPCGENRLTYLMMFVPI